MTGPTQFVFSIPLPGGGSFPVWSHYVAVLPAPQAGEAVYPWICPNAVPQLPKAYGPIIEKVWRDKGLATDGDFLHWVGAQDRIEGVCTCFGLPPMPDLET